MNTLIKPPCTNGEAAAKTVDTWLETVAKRDANAISGSNRKTKLDESHIGCTILTDGRGESPCYVYDNMRDYAKSQGYTVIIDETGSVKCPYAFKGYNHTTGELKQDAFSYLFIGEDNENPVYATAAHCQQKLADALNYQQFMQENITCMVSDINDLDLLTDGTTISEETAENLVYAYRVKILQSLTKYDPYHVGEHYHELMLAYTTAYNNGGIWRVSGVTTSDIDLEKVTISNNITLKTVTGLELTEALQWKFLEQDYDKSLETAEAIIEHLIQNPNYPDSIARLMHQYRK